jgi:hypothetical protein
MVEKGNTKETHSEFHAYATMGGTSATHEGCVKPRSASVKESVVPNIQKCNLFVSDRSWLCLRLELIECMAYLVLIWRGSDDELLSDKVQESQTKGEVDLDSHKLGLTMLNYSDPGLNKKSSVLLHEMEEKGDLGDNEMIEKEMTSDVNMQITDKQRLPETRFSERVCNQMLKKQECS